MFSELMSWIYTGISWILLRWSSARLTGWASRRRGPGANHNASGGQGSALESTTTSMSGSPARIACWPNAWRRSAVATVRGLFPSGRHR